MEHDAIDKAGGPVQIARMFGIASPSVTLWRKRGIPADRCPSIERHTEGRVPVEELRPDIRWVRVPDPDWPNPAGRPCHDYAGPVPTDRAPPTAGLPAAHQVPHAAAAL